MRIAFIHQHRAMLPEISAYMRFFEAKGHQTSVCTNAHKAGFIPDVEWYFMGFQGRRKFSKSILIHEYASASVPPFAGWKDCLKRYFLPTPDFRIYLNEWTKNRLKHRDRVPNGLRDMGVFVNEQKDQHGLKTSSGRYDFIYPGSLYPYPYFKNLLQQFATGTLRKHTILILANATVTQREDWKQFSNIHFESPVAPDNLNELLRQARFGLNVRPVGAPFDFQTSTKILEYAAAGLPIVTTDSTWLKQFLSTQGGACYVVKEDFSNLIFSDIESYPYVTPRIDGYSWEEQILKSGVYEFLLSRLSRPSENSG